MQESPVESTPQVCFRSALGDALFSFRLMQAQLFRFIEPLIAAGAQVRHPGAPQHLPPDRPTPTPHLPETKSWLDSVCRKPDLVLPMATEKSATSYDELPYPGAAQAWTHPDQLATKATLGGMQPAPIEQCRVLELGCGDGTNLLAMAFGLPNSHFVGIDLARKPLEGGIAIAKNLGLKNVDFRCANVLDLGSELGKFDYIIIPGLYSWVPENVRDKLMELCGQCLSPNGVAVVSYNAYPGCYSTTVLRDMMAYHLRSIQDPHKKIRQARGLLNILVKTQPENSAYRAALEEEMKRISGYMDAVFYHDDLNPHYHPVFFHEFIEHASRHGLQYLGERCESVLNPDEHPEEIRGPLRQLQHASILEREQYLDLIQNRRFRCTLLCSDELTSGYDDGTQQIDKMFVGISKDFDFEILVEPASGVRFEGSKETLAKTRHPLLVAAVSHLLKVRPRFVSFDELLRVSQSSRDVSAHVGCEPDEDWISEKMSRSSGADENLDLDSAKPLEKDFRVLKGFVLRCYMARLLNLVTREPNFVTYLSERPVASALARALIRQARFVPSLRHDSIAFDDELGRRLLELLDGTRDRSDLLRELNASVASNKAQLPDGVTSVSAELLEEKLTGLAQLALLSA